MGDRSGDELDAADKRRIPAIYTDELTPGEEPLLLMRARIPRSASGILTFAPLSLLVWAFDAVRNRRLLGHARRATAGIGFPLDRRMRILVTTRRLLVWRHRGARSPEHLGTVPCDDVLAARLPFVGGGSWRFVELHLRVGFVIRFQVEESLAEQFVHLLDTIDEATSNHGRDHLDSEARLRSAGIEFPDRPEGPVSAAILAAGIGCLALGVLTTLAEASTRISDWLAFNSDVGPLSGKTIGAVAVWLVAWVILHLVYRQRPFETRRAFTIALVLIALGVIGTFPTFFQAFGSG